MTIAEIPPSILMSGQPEDSKRIAAESRQHDLQSGRTTLDHSRLTSFQAFLLQTFRWVKSAGSPVAVKREP